MEKRADARKDSTAVAGNGSGGRDAVNIHDGGSGENRPAGQIILNLTLVIALLVNLLLLHIILTKIKHLEITVNRIEKNGQEHMESQPCRDYFKILICLVLLVGHEVR